MIMKKKSSLICLSLLLLVTLSGCTSSVATTATPQPTLAPTPLPTMADKETTSTAPSFEIVGLHNGDVIAQDEINMQVILNNFTLLDRNTELAPSANQGHIHYWLDTNPTDPGAAVQIDKDPEHILLSNLKAGQHILTVKLVGTDHQPATETTTQIISFLVKRSSAADSATPKPKDTTSTPQPTMKNTVNEADAESAIMSIVGLQNGDIVTTDDLKFAINVKNLNLVNYSDHPEAIAGEGHIHIWLDTTSTEPKAAMKVFNDPKHIVIKKQDLVDGDHTIIIGLVSNDHQTIIGDRQAITFTVKR
jgi:hypothetical protein